MRKVRWSALRTVGNSAPSRISVLAPIFGYLILFNAEVSEFLNTFTGYGGLVISQSTASQPSSLYFYFYGSVVFGIGSALYFLFCDNIIKQFKGHVEYISSTIEDISPLEVFDICNIIISNGADHEKRFAYIRDISAGGYPRSKETVREVLYANYNILDTKMQGVAIACLLLYMLGITLISIPSAIFFVKVTLSIIG